MSTGTILLIVIPLLVVLAGVLLAGAARRRETDDAVGAPQPRDPQAGQGRRPSTPSSEPTGQEIERQAVLARSGKLVPAEPAPLEPYTPPDAETARRHPAPVPQPGDRRPDHLLPGRLRWRGPGLRVAPGPGRASAPRSGSGPSTTSRPTSRRATASSTCPRAACGSPSTPPNDLAKAQAVYSPAELTAMEAGVVPALPDLPAPGLPGAEL